MGRIATSPSWWKAGRIHRRRHRRRCQVPEIQAVERPTVDIEKEHSVDGRPFSATQTGKLIALGIRACLRVDHAHIEGGKRAFRVPNGRGPCRFACRAHPAHLLSWSASPVDGAIGLFRGELGRPSVGPMAIRLQLKGDLIVVRLSGLGRLLAVKGRLDIPRSHVTSAEVMPRPAVPPTPGTWLRAPGTHIPGLIRYGSYGKKPNREFWAVYRQREVLVISITDWAYSRLILATRDPHADESLLKQSP